MTMQKMTPDDLRAHKGISFTGITTPFFCHDGKGRFFMARRSIRARDEHGRWDMGAGGLKWGFSAEDNVRREIQEEYGATPLALTFLGYDDIFRTTTDGTQTHWLALYFAALVDPAMMRICEPDMFDEAGWFTLDDLPAPLHSQFPAFLEKYNTKLQTLLAGGTL